MKRMILLKTLIIGNYTNTAKAICQNSWVCLAVSRIYSFLDIAQAMRLQLKLEGGQRLVDIVDKERQGDNKRHHAERE